MYDRLSVEGIYFIFSHLLCLVGCLMSHQRIIQMGMGFGSVNKVIFRVGDPHWLMGDVAVFHSFQLYPVRFSSPVQTYRDLLFSL